MSSGIRDFGVTFSSKIFILFISIGTQSCLAWVLGPGGRGSYTVCILFMTLLSHVFVIGCDYAGIYYVASKKLSISESVIYICILGGIGSIFAIGAGLIIMQFPLSFLLKATPMTFYLSLIFIPISVFSNIFIKLLTAMHQFVLFSIFSTAMFLAQLLFTVTFLLVFSWGVEGALCAHLAAGILSICITLTFIHSKYKLRWVKPTLQNLRAILLYDGRHYIGKLSGQINLQIGTIILAMFATQEEIGLFAVAVSIASQATIVPFTLETVLIPRVAVDHTGRKELVAKSARVSGIIVGIVLVILVIFARPIVIVLFSSAFLPSVTLIRILAIGILARCVGSVFASFLLGTNRPGIVSIAVASAVLVNLVLLWLLFPSIGLAGAAIAMVAGFFVFTIIFIISFSRISGFSLFEILHFRRSDWTILSEFVNQVRRKFFSVSSNNL